MQCVKLAIIHELDLDEVKMTTLGKFDRRLGGGFEEIIYELRIVGRASRREVEGMLRDAEKMCFAHNTLKKAVQVKLKAWYNGEPLPLE